MKTMGNRDSLDEQTIFDDHPIMSVISDRIIRVGVAGVTKIEPYHENGEMAPVLWLKIYCNEKIVSRINSKFITTIDYRVNENA